ncbi:MULTISPECIES: hypothetical protein [Pseudomonadaceae]|uniref:hypothetical protein n=1 Tax=Pseudomonadaceae TaxID=135621 RepID=UPI0015E2D0CE|nr:MULTISPECIES: hypothetical protein [Pseudomonadaceae]MBA1280600.1 hypothetical protein [Stutzerimonas stutzeri]MBH8610672.1 hypothetical protein [Pseudomonas mohnii]
MECKCGGNTKDSKVERSKAKIRLEYRVCNSCGRNEYGALLVNDEVVAKGTEAQRAFAALEDGAPAPAPNPKRQPKTPALTEPQQTDPAGPVSTAVPVIEAGAQSETDHLEHSEDSNEPEDHAEDDGESDIWFSTANNPKTDSLIKVRFKTGGYYIERTGYFSSSWDIVDAWQPYDNASALKASLACSSIPAKYRVESLHELRYESTEPAKESQTASWSPAARTPAPVTALPEPEPEPVPVGMTLSLF